MGLLFHASLHYLWNKKRHTGDIFRTFNDDSNHEISEKRSSFSLTESLIKQLEILPSFSTFPIDLKPLKLPNVWTPRNFEHTVKPTADTCGPEENIHGTRVSTTQTSRPFSSTFRQFSAPLNNFAKINSCNVICLMKKTL